MSRNKKTNLISFWKLRTSKDLSRLLGENEESLIEISNSAHLMYRSREEPKKTGGKRPIDIPGNRLKWIQSKINKRLLQKTRVHRSAMGGIRGKRLKDNAQKHVGKNLVAKFDLENYFSNISHQQVYDRFCSIGCSPDVARVLTKLTTYKGRIPQGAPTSTMLANLVAGYARDSNSFNARIDSLAKKRRATATTWVDDVTMSGPRYIQKEAKTFEKIARQSGFIPNSDKNEFTDSNQQQFVTGAVVNQKANVSKNYRKTIRAELHQLKVHGPRNVCKEPIKKIKERIRSKIAHVASLNHQHGNKLLKEFRTID